MSVNVCVFFLLFSTSNILSCDSLHLLLQPSSRRILRVPRQRLWKHSTYLILSGFIYMNSIYKFFSFFCPATNYKSPQNSVCIWCLFVCCCGDGCSIRWNRAYHSKSFIWQTPNAHMQQTWNIERIKYMAAIEQVADLSFAKSHFFYFFFFFFIISIWMCLPLLIGVDFFRRAGDQANDRTTKIGKNTHAYSAHCARTHTRVLCHTIAVARGRPTSQTNQQKKKNRRVIFLM